MELILPDVAAACNFGGTCLTLLARAKTLTDTLTEESTYEERLSVRNQILAGDGIAAQFWGTISTEPTVTVDYAKTWLLPDIAETIITSRDATRAWIINFTKQAELELLK